MFSSRRLAYGWWREGGKYRYLLLLLRVSLPLLTGLLEGPGGPAAVWLGWLRVIRVLGAKSGKKK